MSYYQVMGNEYNIVVGETLPRGLTRLVWRSEINLDLKEIEYDYVRCLLALDGTQWCADMNIAVNYSDSCLLVIG
jgi:hypothetical protein